MRVLVTRPEPDAGDLSKRITAMGHTSVVDPLLAVELLPPAERLPPGAAALVATSRNALRALEASPALAAAIGLPLFAVGPTTAEFAQSLGFARIYRGAGTARELAPLITSTLRDTLGPVVHFAGEAIAYDLAPELKAAGRRVIRITVYRTVAAESFRPDTLDLLRRSAIDGVLLMSPRTAAVYRGIVEAASLGPVVRAIPHLCLSPRVAEALEPLRLQDVRTAVRPTSEELLALLAAERHTPPRIA